MTEARGVTNALNDVVVGYAKQLETNDSTRRTVVVMATDGLFLCPVTCGVVQAISKAEVSVELVCQRVDAPLR